MIPKKIHYCWFGGHEKSDLAKKCIESWQRVQPDFELVEWNESNADLEANEYVKQAYAGGKWAFVSDFVRAKAMYENGGFYLDTDMELKHPLNEFLDHQAVCGIEVKGVPFSAFWAAEKGHPFSKDILDFYYEQEGFEEKINTEIFSNLLVEKYGAVRDLDQKQELTHGVVLYPSNYFSQDLPKNYIAHHFSGSWFGGDPNNTFKNMVNTYGALKILSELPNGPTSVREAVENHRIIDINTVLDQIPREMIEKYLEEKKNGG